MESRAYQTTPTPVLAFLPSLLATKTNRPLIEDVRKLRKSGQRVGILAIQRLSAPKVPMTDADKAPLSLQDNNIYNRINDSAMADGILSAAVYYRNYTIVALTGSSHTSTKVGNSRDPNYRPMGHLISELQPTFIIGVHQGAGEYWGLTKQGFAIHKTGEGDVFGKEDRVDAVVNIAISTASPPAVNGGELDTSVAE